MRNFLRLAAPAAFVFIATPALAAPTIDGTVGPGEYGAPTATVATDPGAPNSNFGTPGNTAMQEPARSAANVERQDARCGVTAECAAKRTVIAAPPVTCAR